jgi:single-stranded-DNA-specific exonuclease
VVGLVAGKLAEEYGRPVLVLDRSELLATGSGRSTAGFDMVAALTFAKDLLKKYGGHTQAAGFTLDRANIPDFHQKLLEYADNFYEIAQPVLEIDSTASAADLNWDNFNLIEKMAPFGIGNPKPRFLSAGLTVADLRTVGNANQHLKLKLKAGDKVFDAIGFGKGFLLPSLSIGSAVDAVFELSANSWNGHSDLQLKIIDLKPHE